MTDRDIISELILTLKRIRTECKQMHPNVQRIRAQADEAIDAVEELLPHIYKDRKPENQRS